MNLVYNLAKQKFLRANLAWQTDTIKAILVGSGYVPNVDTHEFVSSISSGDRIVPFASAVTLNNRTTTLGVADADDITFPNVASGSTVRAVVLFDDNGADTNSALIAYIDGRFRLTITGNTTSQAAFNVDPLAFAVANGAVLTRISGSGPASVTLSGSGGGAQGARVLTANTNVSMVLNDVYEVDISGGGLPVATNGGNIIVQWDNGTNKIFRL